MALLIQIRSTYSQTIVSKCFTRTNVIGTLKENRKLHSCSVIPMFMDYYKDSECDTVALNHKLCRCRHQNILSGNSCLQIVKSFQVPRRTFSIETYNKYFSPEVPPIGFAQKVLEGIHSATGLPWWASIAVSTLILRGMITLPLAVYSMHIMARVEFLQPEIGKLSEELRREVAVAVKTFAWDAKYARYKYNSTMNKLIKDLYIRDNCHPAKSSLVLWFQIPMWICLSFALRNMSGAVPTASADAQPSVLCPHLRSEGALWFSDLTVPDSTWVLPVLLGLTNLLNIELHSLTTQRVSKFQKTMVFVMRSLSLVMIPIGSVVPSCMCYYWVCSSIFGLGQTLLFKLPSVRRVFRVPQTPSQSQTPFRDMYKAAKLKYRLRPKQKEA